MCGIYGWGIGVLVAPSVQSQSVLGTVTPTRDGVGHISKRKSTILSRVQVSLGFWYALAQKIRSYWSQFTREGWFSPLRRQDPGPATAECQDCTLAKMTQQIVHQPAPDKSGVPFYRVFVDWHDLPEDEQEEGHPIRRCMFITCECTGLVLAYFTTSSKESENLPIMKDAVHWIRSRYGLPVKVVRADGEMNRHETRNWFFQAGISIVPSAPDTHEQNGGAERMGRTIITKARAMRISAKLPQSLWREIVQAAAYLYIRTPRRLLDWTRRLLNSLLSAITKSH